MNTFKYLTNGFNYEKRHPVPWHLCLLFTCSLLFAPRDSGSFEHLCLVVGLSLDSNDGLERLKIRRPFVSRQRSGVSKRT